MVRRMRLSIGCSTLSKIHSQTRKEPRAVSNPFDKLENQQGSGSASEEPPLLSVSQLNRQVKSLLESHFGFVWVEGEISNFAAPSSGHWYFSLKDGNAQVRCAMFRNRNSRVRFSPGNGDAIKLRCRVSLYEGRGEFQLIVEHMEPAGSGALQMAFEKLKAKLLTEGLFDEEQKQPIPDEIQHLGVITSPTGAAIHDILSVLARRAPSVSVSLLPVAVQGADAAGQIADAIERANRWVDEGKVSLDALIVGRGGGSLEDLWAFNEEIVARAIAASDLPIISAVGHEVDFSIADMVADLRAPTPSAAAELATEDEAETLALLQSVEQELGNIMLRKLKTLNQTLTNKRLRLKHPGAMLREKAQRLDDIENRLIANQRHRLARDKGRVKLIEAQLLARSPSKRIIAIENILQQHRQSLEQRITRRLHDTRKRIELAKKLLASLSPTGILKRGYAILADEKGNIVRTSAELAVGDTLEAQLAQGKVGLNVKRVD